MIISIISCQSTMRRSIPLWNLSPEPVQKYPIFLGLMSLGVKGGLSSGGVGTCKIGKGGAMVVKGSVTPGIVGMRGGKERHSPRATRDAMEAKEYFILLERKIEQDCVGLMSIFAGNLESLYTRVCPHLVPNEVSSCSSPESSRQ